MKRAVSRATIFVAVLAASFGMLVAGGAFGATTGEIVTYTSTVTIPVPPASDYAGTGGGDGWDIALSTTQVFNVFHHSSTVTVACHQQSDASECYPARTVTDNGTNFASSGHSGTYYDINSGHLYIYAVRADNTAGVVCFDTTTAAANPNPFCGFTALSAVGEGQNGSGTASTSLPMQVGSRLYAFNYVNGTPSGTKDTVLCFDLNAVAPCAGQPYSIDIGSGDVGVNTFPVPATAAIGGQLIIPITTGSTQRIACFNANTGSGCAGFPIDAAQNGDGAPFPMLDAAGNTIGFCIPTTGSPCYGLGGASVPTPAGLAAAITPDESWNGKNVVIGPRVYVANGSVDAIQCFDYSTGASCVNFPHPTSGSSYIYTVNPDWQRPTCLWVNADGGASQIQSFDAFTGGACGEGAIRVISSQLVVPQEACTPTSYRTFEVLQPDRTTYANGTVGFATFNGAPSGVPDQAIGDAGLVNLAGIGLEQVDQPQFLVTLNGAPPTSEVVLRLTWDAGYDEVCVAGNVAIRETPVPLVIAPRFTG